MKEYKAFIWVGIFLIFAVGGLIFLAGQSSQETAVKPELDETVITLFYGDGCPHCKDVEEFNEKNDIKSKVDFVELEVWKNKDNAKMMEKAAIICGLDLEKIGVPFLFAEGQCYIGGPDVQDFFAQKAGI